MTTLAALPPPEALSDRDVVALLEAALREKDEIIAAQYQEIVTLRAQADGLLEAVEHWRAKASEKATT